MTSPVWLRNFRSRQVRSLDSRRHGLIEASAGTGKTFAIEHLVLRLVVENPAWNPEEILLLSFTDKTVAELRERIRTLLHAQREDFPSDKKIAGWSPRDASRIRQVWLHADELSIQTLHAFCRSALQRDPVANHALLRTELVKDAVIAEIALDRLLRDTWPADPQRLADIAEATGVGSETGRRKLIGLALKWQPWRGDVLDPDRAPDPRILQDLLTASGDAARALPAALAAVEAGSFPLAAFRQSFALTEKGRPRKNPEEALRKDPFQKLFLQAEESPPSVDHPHWSRDALLSWFRKTYTAAAKVVKQKEWATALPPAAVTLPEWQELARLCAVIRNACDSITAARTSRRLGLLAEAVQELRHAVDEEKTRRGLISYEDMPRQLVEALRRNPALATRLARRYKVCIVDEFQDTDPLQWEILEALCLRQEPRPGAEPRDALPPPLPLFLVGDPKQAIYSFRGGDLDTYLNARTRLHALASRGRAQGLGLDANHRSRKALIDVLNAVFSQEEWFGPTPEAPADPAWQLPAASDQIVFTPVTAGRSGDENTPAPALIVREFGVAEESPASAEGGEKRSGPRKPDVERAVRGWIAARIAGAVRRNEAQPKDFAVLTRANAEGEAIARLLKRRGVPCRIRQKHGPFHGPAADALRLLLEWIDDAASPDVQTRILMLPFARRDDHDIPRGRPDRCPPLIARWAMLAQAGRWPEFFLSVFHEGGYRERLAAASAADEAHFTQMINQLSVAGAAPGTTARMLCDRFDALRRGEDAAEGDGEDTLPAHETGGGAVSIMTLHLSKGLEFPHVFVAASGGGQQDDFRVLRDTSIPGFRIALDKSREDFKQQAEAQTHEENKRLYYVGFTRARETLYVPLLPPKFSRSAPGPLGGFAANAIREVAQDPRFTGHVLFDEAEVEPVVLRSEVTGGEEALASGPSRAALIEDTRGAFARRRLLTSYSRLALRAAAADGERKNGGEGRDAARGADAGGSGGVTPGDGPRGAFPSGPAMTEPLLAEDGTRAQRQETVTELTGHEGDDTGASEGMTEDTPGASVITAAELPPGAAAGTALHALLEHTPFASVLEAESPEAWLEQPGRRTRVEEVLKRESVDAVYAPAAARAVWNALRAPLPEGPRTHPGGTGEASAGFRLADLAPTDLHHEVEFLLSCDHLSGIAPAADPAARAPDAAPEDIGVNIGMKATSRGQFLWGFIDLVFRRAGRYYLLDWKSNLLPAYDAETVNQSMHAHRYHLQGKLYAVALDRWLSARVPGYDPALHFGGVHYLYLRGTTPAYFAGFSTYPGPQELRVTWPREIASLLAASSHENAGASSSPTDTELADETR